MPYMIPAKQALVEWKRTANIGTSQTQLVFGIWFGLTMHGFFIYVQYCYYWLSATSVLAGENIQSIILVIKVERTIQEYFGILRSLLWIKIRLYFYYFFIMMAFGCSLGSHLSIVCFFIYQIITAIVWLNVFFPSIG